MKLRKDENICQDPHSGAWYAEVLNYPGCFPKWVRIGGAHDSRRAAEFTLEASRIED